jgi:hypothetical protein
MDTFTEPDPVMRTRLDKVNDISQTERVKWLVKQLGRRGRSHRHVRE